MASPRYPKHIPQLQHKAESSQRQKRTETISPIRDRTKSPVIIPIVIISPSIATHSSVTFDVHLYQGYRATPVEELLIANQRICARSPQALSHVWLRSPNGALLHRGHTAQDSRAHPQTESGRIALERAGIG